MTAKTVSVAVAVIGAVATLGAAFLSNAGKAEKAKDPPSPLQQTSSGAGAVNVGRDAYITNNIAKSAGEESAERVQACEAQHGMKNSTEKKQSTEPLPRSRSDEGSSVEHTSFQFCGWPKSPFADGDGYLEIKVDSVAGPGESEASGANNADRVSAPCPRPILAYQFGTQGAYENAPSFAVSANSIVSADGKPWLGKRGTLPFYPNESEIVVLRNDHYVIGSARCP